MYEFYPYFTNDGSTGLYSPEDDDIYHSAFGALTEAYEKFILPAEFDFKNNSEIKILDLCFGIGYNTKSFLNYFLDFLYNETIYTDNNSNKNKCIEKIFTDNKKYKISIHAVDKDKNLACMSPFIVTDKKISNKNRCGFKNAKIEKMLSGKTKINYKLKKEVNILLLNKLAEKIQKDAEDVIFSKEYSEFFDSFMKRYYEFFKYERIQKHPLRNLNAFLHNIYYLHISTWNKKAMKCLKLFDFNFKLSIGDARQIILDDKNTYNYIFLDAFTPAKCPCLWTLDFFKLLYKLLDNNGMILTYSNSAAIRNAFIEAGFFVGKNSLAGKSNGTIAVKNKLLIKNELSEFDLGLLNTKAGIFYRDEYLNASNEEIIAAHKTETENSTLISSSKFIKEFSKP